MALMGSIKKLFPNSWKHRVKTWFGMVNGPIITKGKNVFIATTAIVECRHGGNITIGDDSEILEGVLLLTYGGDITIGDRCSVNPYTIIYGHGNTRIGNDVLIAGHCMIIPNQHEIGNAEKTIRDQGNTSRGITIENNVWIGHGCSILDGVTIGEGAVIGAGSVVTKDVPPFAVVTGIPATITRYRK
jgi:acetyltransferase-like isoleucine patch superfamily enzyme